MLGSKTGLIVICFDFKFMTDLEVELLFKAYMLIQTEMFYIHKKYATIPVSKTSVKYILIRFFFERHIEQTQNTR